MDAWFKRHYFVSISTGQLFFVTMGENEESTTGPSGRISPVTCPHILQLVPTSEVSAADRLLSQCIILIRERLFPCVLYLTRKTQTTAERKN